MKILHVNTEKGWRGGEQQVLYLVSGLLKNNITCTVACLNGSQLEERCKKAYINTLPLSGNQVRDAIKIGISGREFSIIHAHAAKSHNISIMSKLIHNNPVIYTRRVDYLPSKNPLTKLKYGKTERIVCVVKEIENIITKYGIEQKKVTTIHSAVDTELERKVDRQKVKKIKETINGNPLIGNIGALTKQKNQLNFIKAAKILSNAYPEAKFVIVGDGPLKQRLTLTIEKMNMHNRIKLLGFQGDIQNYIRSLDVLVLSSDNEGIGGTLLQAMVLKVPVVATNVGGVKEVVKNGITGILVEKNNPEKLASGITKVLSNSTLRKSLVDNAFKFAYQNFSVDKMVNAYIRVYREVLSVG